MVDLNRVQSVLVSRPAWGAWIEITFVHDPSPMFDCRAPHGARGLKFSGLVLINSLLVVAPRMGRVD